jgi:hypothetical protein
VYTCIYSTIFGVSAKQWQRSLRMRPKISFFSFYEYTGSAAGIAGRPRSRCSSPGRVKNVLFSMSSRPALRPTQPPVQCVSSTPPTGVKRQRREADHSPPASAEVKKMWIDTSTPHTPSWCSAKLVKHRDSFILQGVMKTCTDCNCTAVIFYSARCNIWGQVDNVGMQPFVAVRRTVRTCSSARMSFPSLVHYWQHRSSNPLTLQNYTSLPI